MSSLALGRGIGFCYEFRSCSRSESLGLRPQAPLNILVFDLLDWFGWLVVLFGMNTGSKN
ncbi:MAG: hypothetical protein ACKVOT_04295 [Polaromonas sp.]